MNSSVPLTDEQIGQARVMRTTGASWATIGTHLGVSRRTVQKCCDPDFAAKEMAWRERDRGRTRHKPKGSRRSENVHTSVEPYAERVKPKFNPRAVDERVIKDLRAKGRSVAFIAAFTRVRYRDITAVLFGDTI